MRATTLIFALALVAASFGCIQGDDPPANDPGAAGGRESGETNPSRNAFVASSDPWNEPVTKVVYLDQNWTSQDSLRFYFTAQGSQLIPYDWFLALEQANSTKPFRDNENILKYRYLPQNKGPLNPDGMPVGFVAGEGISRRWLGLTCAACHTTEIRLGTTAYRVDGAPTHADVQALLADLAGAMQRTLTDTDKFDRFADSVLGANNSAANRSELKAELAKSIKLRVGYNLRNFVGYDPKQIDPVPPTRFGRLDAVDAIVNEVYWRSVRNADLDKPTVVARPADALVSYPCIWDTPQHDRVEWLGIAKGGGPDGVFSLSRNVGEVLGVFGDFAIPDDPTLLNLGYHSSVKFSQLKDLEQLLKTLWSPLWPDDFPKIDRVAAAKGEELYKRKLNNQKSCLECHAIINRSDPNRRVVAKVTPTGTDSRAFDNFFNPTRPSGKLEGVHTNFLPLSPRIPAEADANTMLSNVVIGVLLGSFKEAPPDELRRIDFSGNRPKELTANAVLPPEYKGRPLNGIWATAPYLHNGSVPTLDALLRPAKDRPKTFSVGVRTFDPVKVGYLTDVPGFPTFNVQNPDGSPILGNSNAGHEYGTSLADEERRQLVEYLKTL